MMALAIGVVLGAMGAYVLFFSAHKAADPAGLAKRLSDLEERVRLLER